VLCVSVPLVPITVTVKVPGAYLESSDAGRAEQTALHLVQCGSYCPVPVSLTTCGLPDALCVTVTTPGIAPGCFGLNVTANVQLLCALTILPQGLVPPAAAAYCPLATTLVRVSAIA
jgi:hypothetical protein